MGEAHFHDIGISFVGDLVIGQEPAAVAALPGSQMDFVDGNRRRNGLRSGPVAVSQPWSFQTSGCGDDDGGRRCSAAIPLSCPAGRPSAAAAIRRRP